MQAQAQPTPIARVDGDMEIFRYFEASAGCLSGGLCLLNSTASLVESVRRGRRMSSPNDCIGQYQGCGYSRESAGAVKRDQYGSGAWVYPKENVIRG